MTIIIIIYLYPSFIFTYLIIINYFIVIIIVIFRN